MSGFNLADLFEAVAAAIPDREALVADDRRLTFATLDERATRLAHALAEMGVGAGDRVAVYLYNGTEYLEAMLAAFKLRALPVNVNYRYVADELRYLFDDADIKAVVHEPAFAPTLDAVEAQLETPLARLERGPAYEDALAAASADGPFGPRSGDDLYVLYTGGTTGMPKGVLWRQEDLFFAALGGGNPGGPPIADPSHIVDRARRGRQRCLPASPFMHGAAHWFALSMLLTGSTVVVSTRPTFDPDALLDLVTAERVTFLVIVGDAFGRPLADALESQPRRWDLSALAVILSGGAILSPSVKTKLLAHVPTAIVVDGFGASESGGHGQAVEAAGSDGERPRFRVGPETSVLDDDLRPIEPGSGRVGRLARRGHIPLGYHKDPERTAATFPTVDGVRWALPGDMATIEEDGTVVVLGRGSVSINTGGEKVYPEEVESCLKGHPAVYDAVVVGLPDERWGERVCAVVAARAGQSLPAADVLASFCGHTLASYKLPRHVVEVDEIVRSASGKPDYRWARDTAAKALTT